MGSGVPRIGQRQGYELPKSAEKLLLRRFQQRAEQTAENIAEAAKARVISRSGGDLRSGVNPVDLVDVTIWAAAKIASGVIKTEKALVKAFNESKWGKAFLPYVTSIWKDAKEQSTTVLRDYGRAPLFYSKMEAEVAESLKNEPTNTGEVMQAFQKAVEKNVITQDELRWSGIQKWLTERGGKVTKREVLRYLAAHQIAVKETILGEVAPHVITTGRVELTTSGGPLDVGGLSSPSMGEPIYLGRLLSSFVFDGGRSRGPQRFVSRVSLSAPARRERDPQEPEGVPAVFDRANDLQVRSHVNLMAEVTDDDGRTYEVRADEDQNEPGPAGRTRRLREERLGVDAVTRWFYRVTSVGEQEGVAGPTQRDFDVTGFDRKREDNEQAFRATLAEAVEWARSDLESQSVVDEETDPVFVRIDGVETGPDGVVRPVLFSTSGTSGVVELTPAKRLSHRPSAERALSVERGELGPLRDRPGILRLLRYHESLAGRIDRDDPRWTDTLLDSKGRDVSWGRDRTPEKHAAEADRIVAAMKRELRWTARREKQGLQEEERSFPPTPEGKQQAVDWVAQRARDEMRVLHETQYDSWVMGDLGTNYRELLFHLPPLEERLDAETVRLMEGLLHFQENMSRRYNISVPGIEQLRVYLGKESYIGAAPSSDEAWDEMTGRDPGRQAEWDVLRSNMTADERAQETQLFADIDRMREEQAVIREQMIDDPDAFDYDAPHFEGEGLSSGLLAHLRFNERESTDERWAQHRSGGRKAIKVFFIEEGQSDLHQQARDRKKARVEEVMKERGITKEEASQLVSPDYGYRGADEAEVLLAEPEYADGETTPVAFRVMNEDGTLRARIPLEALYGPVPASLRDWTGLTLELVNLNDVISQQAILGEDVALDAESEWRPIRGWDRSIEKYMDAIPDRIEGWGRLLDHAGWRVNLTDQEIAQQQAQFARARARLSYTADATDADMSPENEGALRLVNRLEYIWMAVEAPHLLPTDEDRAAVAAAIPNEETRVLLRQLWLQPLQAGISHGVAGDRVSYDTASIKRLGDTGILERLFNAEDPLLVAQIVRATERIPNPVEATANTSMPSTTKAIRSTIRPSTRN